MGSITITDWEWDAGAEVSSDDPADWEERSKVKFSGIKCMHFFQPMLRISAGNRKGPKLGCAGRLQSSGCY